MACGIYLIRHVLTGRCYIGSTTDRRRRWYTHRRTLERGIHHCSYLQRAWKKYGPEAFEFVWLQDARPDELLVLEQQLLDTTANKYNTSKSAHAPWLGLRHTDESRAKMRAASQGRNASAATREKLRLANLGKTIPEQVRKKISQALMGRPRSEEAAKKNRGVGFWWVPGRQCWQARVYHDCQKVCDVYRLTESEAREVVTVVRGQIDAGKPISIPPGQIRRARRAPAKGYSFCKMRKQYRVRLVGKDRGFFLTELEAFAAVSRLRTSEVHDGIAL